MKAARSVFGDAVWRRRLFRSAAVLSAVCLILTATALAEEGATQMATADQTADCLQVEAGQPAGLAWDGDRFWIADADKNVIKAVEPAAETEPRQIQFADAKLGPLAWDGANFWRLDCEARKIHKLDVDTGAIIATIDAPAVELRGKPVQVVGLAWDGEYLWTGCSAGWSSRLYQIDPADGQVKRSVYSKGVPRALTSDGKHLYSAADASVADKPGVLFKYDLDSGRYVGHVKTPAGRTAGLAHDGTNVWRLDDAGKLTRLSNTQQEGR